jgi:hypothetical protein
MTKQRLWLALLVLIASLTQCSSCKENVNPNELPPETQTGAGTFACRINGEVWRYNDPTGINLKPRTSLRYDSIYKGGAIEINGLRYNKDNVSIDQLGLYVDSISARKEIILVGQPLSEGTSICYSGNKDCDNLCTVKPILNSFRQGKITITKLDNKLGIIAGRFNCIIFQPGCDTLKITEGRFDIKF